MLIPDISEIIDDNLLRAPKSILEMIPTCSLKLSSLSMVMPRQVLEVTCCNRAPSSVTFVVLWPDLDRHMISVLDLLIGSLHL